MVLLHLAAEPRDARRTVVAAAHDQPSARRERGDRGDHGGSEPHGRSLAWTTPGTAGSRRPTRPTSPAVLTVTPSRYRHLTVVGPVAPPRSVSRSREGSCSLPSRPPPCSAPPAIPVTRRGPRRHGPARLTASSAMPDAACRESRDRVRAAVMSSGSRLAARSASRSTSPRPGRARSAPASTWPSPSACSCASEQLPPERSPGSGSSASSASTARCGGSRAWRRWSPCSATSIAVVPGGVGAPRPLVAAHGEVRVASTLAEVARRARRRSSRGRTSPTPRG